MAREQRLQRSKVHGSDAKIRVGGAIGLEEKDECNADRFVSFRAAKLPKLIAAYSLLVSSFWRPRADFNFSFLFLFCDCSYSAALTAPGCH
jgi:hypothetical protein